MLAAAAIVASSCDSSGPPAASSAPPATTDEPTGDSDGRNGDGKGGQNGGKDGKGDGKGPANGEGKGDGEGKVVVPSLHLRVLSSRVVLADRHQARPQARRAVRLATRKVRQVLEALHRDAFLDPRNWRQARYEEVLNHFVGRARRAARKDLATLTLGRGADELLETVGRPKGIMRSRVLVGAGGRALTAAVTTRFSAKAQRTAGGLRVVSGRAHWFLRPSPRGWLVFAYDMRRLDHLAGK